MVWRVKADLRVSLTNVTGLGASQLVRSLLPAIEAVPDTHIEQLYLPTTGELADFLPSSSSTRISHWHRTLPKPLSRILECIVLGTRFDGPSPLLVLGDVPVRTRARQTVFLQNSHFLPPPVGDAAMRYRVSRAIFRANLPRVAEILVQTSSMRDMLIATYPIAPEHVHIVAQPPPEWLLKTQLRRTARVKATDARLRLFYPAAGYPHKNHRLLARATGPRWSATIAQALLTVPAKHNPQPGSAWIECVNRLQPDAMLRAYAQADALLFLSKAESFGLPLVEAMWIGLPVVAPDLPYARALCGNSAIYFDPDDDSSLFEALAQLRARLDVGWWPDWSGQLAAIPRSWSEVAARMVAVALG